MNQTYMKEKKIFPLVMSMALPMMLSMAFNSLYNIVDSYFVAKLSEDAMTALSDHPGTSSESDPESRDQEKNSASDLCAEFYFRYRTLRYGSYVSFTGRSAE